MKNKQDREWDIIFIRWIIIAALASFWYCFIEELRK